MINSTATSSTTTNFMFSYVTPPDDDEPPAGVPARPKPAPGGTPAAGVLVPA